MFLYWGILCGQILVGVIFWRCSGAFLWIRKVLFSRNVSAKQEIYSCLYPRQQPQEAMWKAKKEELKKLYWILLVGTVFALILGYQKNVGAISKDGIIQRDVFRSPEQTVYVEVLGKKGTEVRKEALTLHISGKAPTPKQIDALFEEAERTLRTTLFPGQKAEDGYTVSEDLRLPQEILGDVTLTWKSSRPEVLSSMGNLGEDILPEGISVNLVVEAVYQWLPEMMEEGTVKQTFTFPCRVYPPEDNRSFGERLEDEMISLEQTSRMGDFVLPQVFEGYTLSFIDTETKQISPNGVLGFACLVAVMLYLAADQRLDETYKKRGEQLQVDYPEIVSRLTVLIGSGLTPRKAWERMVLDYEKREGEVRWGYEEMRRTYLGLQGGVYEAGAYGAFGRRCGLYSYIKLGTLLETSVQKGMSDLVEQLQEETLQAFEQRKMEARQIGEKAKTKLLLPTMLLLVILIVILVVPAWLTTGM